MCEIFRPYIVGWSQAAQQSLACSLLIMIPKSSCLKRSNGRLNMSGKKVNIFIGASQGMEFQTDHSCADLVWSWCIHIMFIVTALCT